MSRVRFSCNALFSDQFGIPLDCTAVFSVMLLVAVNQREEYAHSCYDPVPYGVDVGVDHVDLKTWKKSKMLRNGLTKKTRKSLGPLLRNRSLSNRLMPG